MEADLKANRTLEELRSIEVIEEKRWFCSSIMRTQEQRKRVSGCVCVEQQDVWMHSCFNRSIVTLAP
jgi:hypothetical protein